MYLMYYALAFSIFAIPKKDRFVWVTLCILCLLLKGNALIFDVMSDYRYICRTMLICIFAHILLLKINKLGCYQAFILALFLISNLALIHDVSVNKNVLIYNNFEAVIYGLVTCQFVGILPKIWNVLYNYYSNYYNNSSNRSVVETI